MFARDKRIGPYTYVYLVENVREEGRTKQRIIANLGRKEVVVARGDLDRLGRFVVRLAQRSMMLSLVEGEAPPNARCQRVGPAARFARLWHEVGLPRRVRRAGRRPAVRVCCRARGVPDGAPPAVCVGLGPRCGKVASRLPDRGDSGASGASSLPRHGLAPRGAPPSQ